MEDERRGEAEGGGAKERKAAGKAATSPRERK
jgi:hypothetical protein